MALVSALAILPPPGEGTTLEGCPPASGLRLDHVVVAVSDLETSERHWRDDLGFSVKPGRRHANGLENRHLRFADGSEIELMAVTEPAGDDLARWYREWIDDGGGGAFLALDVGSIAAAREPLLEAGLDPAVERVGAWDLASFPLGQHPLDVFFLIDVHRRPADLPEQVEHRNDALGLAEVWVAVSEPETARRFLLALGARSCGSAEHRSGSRGERFAVEGGSIVLVERRSMAERVLAVTLWRRDGGDSPAPVEREGLELDFVPGGSEP